MYLAGAFPNLLTVKSPVFQCVILAAFMAALDIKHTPTKTRKSHREKCCIISELEIHIYPLKSEWFLNPFFPNLFVSHFTFHTLYK